MKVVAFLQNQWWHDPEGVRREIEKHGEKYRRRLLVYGLSQCRSGKVLEKTIASVIGAPDFKDIYWENVSRQFGGRSAAKFPADLTHIGQVILDQRPDVILCFGKVASEAVPDLALCEDLHVLIADHPAARRGHDSLHKMAKDLKELLNGMS